MFGEYLRLALKTLRAYRLRSALTVLSITIGVCAVILLTSLAQSGLATLARGIEEIGGTRFVMVWQDSPKKAAKKAGNFLLGMTYGDAVALRERLPMLEGLTGVRQSDDQVTARVPDGPEKRADMVAADPSFVRIFALPIQDGRNLDDEDLAQQRRVCLLGDELAKKLFQDEDPVGKEVLLKGVRHRVVGRMRFAPKGGMNFGFSWSNLAVVPLTLNNPSKQVSFLAMVRARGTETDTVLDRANAILLHRHNQVDNFQIFDMGGMLKGFYATFFAMIVVVGLVSGMSLVIGGVGIMNIMLVAVAERRREIGLRKAVGASGGSIMRQFLVEAIVLSLFGAVVGVTIGVLLAWATVLIGPMINKGWVGVISQPAIAVALLSSAAIGLFFGWYPAKQAADLDPILCLRSE